MTGTTQKDSTALFGSFVGSTGVVPANIPEIRTESTVPSAYRLARRHDSTLVLQGAYVWQAGWNNSGYEWRDMPTVDLAEGE